RAESTSCCQTSGSDHRGGELGRWLRERIDCVGQLLDLGLGQFVVRLEAVAVSLGVEQRLHCGELRGDLGVEVRILLLEQRTESLEADPGALNVGLKVPEIGTRPV